MYFDVGGGFRDREKGQNRKVSKLVVEIHEHIVQMADIESDLRCKVLLYLQTEKTSDDMGVVDLRKTVYQP